MKELLIQKLEINNKKIKNLKLKILQNDTRINNVSYRIKHINNITNMFSLDKKTISYLIEYLFIGLLLMTIIVLCPNTIYPLLFCICVMPAFLIEDNTQKTLKLFNLPYLYLLEYIYKNKVNKLNDELNKIIVESNELNNQYEKLLNKETSIEKKKLLKKNLEEKIILVNNKIKKINDNNHKMYYTNEYNDLMKRYNNRKDLSDFNITDESSIKSTNNYLIAYDSELLNDFIDLENKIDIIINNQYVASNDIDDYVPSKDNSMGLILAKRN